MGEITSDAAIMAALGRQMTRAVQKQAVAAGNLANVDTPGYQTREARFGDALDAALEPSHLTATHARHFGVTAGATGAADVREKDGLAARRDGNNVQMDRELLALGRAAGEFSSAQTALAAKFRLVRYAINEGR
jgi:flagellar basal-body rod protein FlgB